VQVEDERELEERYPAEASAATSIQGPEGEGRARGLTITVDYEKQVSAAKSRPRFDAMMRDAHRGAFAVLLIWALDRFGRDAIASAPDFAR
jgi:DNA invertase Pin-like site-specific DNA recombinase